MTLRPVWWLGLGLLLGCDLVNTPTKTAKGELYQSGDARYDAYFNQVHQEQIAASTWMDESRQSRKPLVTALDLRAGSSNSVILGAAREKKGAERLTATVNQTISSERERAKKLSAAETRLDELAKRGRDLKKEAIAERADMGADKADDKKVAKKNEIKREVSAAVDAVEHMEDDAKHGSAEADELATKLRALWGGSDDAPGDKPAQPEKPKKADPPPKKPKKPAPPPTDVADKPAPAEKPEKKPPPPAGEVFNP